MKTKFKLLFLSCAILTSANTMAEVNVTKTSETSNQKTSELSSKEESPRKNGEDRMIFAKEIWEKNQENPVAQFYIAEQNYLQGDKDAALSWYLRSAVSGNESAINNAQLMIENNEGTSSNMDEVVKFMNDSALKGDLFSQMYLGDIYRDGRYQKDLEKSYFWYSEATKQGSSRAQYYIGNMTIAGVGTYQNVPKGLRYLEDLAEKGHSGAMYNIGKVYKLGFNIGKNHKEASKWFYLAAKEGHVDSMYEIGDSLERGFGIDKDEKSALEWFETAALHGNTQAAYRAGILNLFLSASSDETYTVEKAIDWLSVSAEEGMLDAQLRMGDLYYEGKFGIKKDYVTAAKWYKLAAAQNDKLAFKKLSMIYRMGGFGVERDAEAYKSAIKEYYTHESVAITKPQEKLKLFNYNIFEY